MNALQYVEETRWIGYLTMLRRIWNAGVHLAIVFSRSYIKLSWQFVSHCLDLRIEKSATPPLANVYSVMTSGEMTVSSLCWKNHYPTPSIDNCTD